MPSDATTTSEGDFTYHENSYAALVIEVFESCFYNLIHDVVLETHRAEKIDRMNSAAVQVMNVAHSVSQLSESAANAKLGVQVQHIPQVKATITAATYDNGRVYLTGNPLKTVREIYCSQCRLPRLPFPLKGEGSRMPDLSKHTHWCNLHPFIRLSGHDVYGNSFPSEQAKTKKERELQKQQAKAERDAANKQAAAEDADSAAVALARLTAESGKPANYIPWHTCPNCKRSLLITRFAQHLEKCLGIAGRVSGRNAMARISASAGRNTPSDSRAASPAVGKKGANGNANGGGSSNGNNITIDDDDDDEEDAKPLKKKKLLSKKDRADPFDKETLRIKLKAPHSRLSDPSGPLTNGSTAAGSSHTSSPLSTVATTVKSGVDGSMSKRERDDSVISVDQPRKKMKTTKEKDRDRRDRDRDRDYRDRDRD